MRHHAVVRSLAGSAALKACMLWSGCHEEHICLLLSALLPAPALLAAGRGLHALCSAQGAVTLASSIPGSSPSRSRRRVSLLPAQCCLVLNLPERSTLGSGEATNLGAYHDHKPSRHNSSISGALLLRCDCCTLRPAFLGRDIRLLITFTCKYVAMCRHQYDVLYRGPQQTEGGACLQCAPLATLREHRSSRPDGRVSTDMWGASCTCRRCLISASMAGCMQAGCVACLTSDSCACLLAGMLVDHNIMRAGCCSHLVSSGHAVFC